MKLLTKEQEKSYQNAKICYIYKEKLVRIKHAKEEYRGTADDICNLKSSLPKKTLIAFHNGSYYDYHFIIKELAEEFEK